MGAPAPGAVETRTRETLARIEASMAGGEAIFLSVDSAGAVAAAAEADARAGLGRARGPLDGALVAVKDNLAMAGRPWTAGIAGWRDRVAAADATAVARLRAAGAVILGGVNLHEGALGATTDNDAFGRCMNPLGPDAQGNALTPGGSSGGSGAAVAAGLADLALGTDTMGSVRIPAAYCGICGAKPTAGLIGRAGLAYLAPTLDTVGPLTRRAADLWPALEALAGVDPEDPDARPARGGWSARPDISLRGVRLGLPKQIETVDCEPAVREGLARAVEVAKRLGARVVALDLEGWDPGRARRGGLLISEAEGAVEMASLMETQGAISDHLAALLAYGRDAGALRMVDAYARIRAAAAACARGLAECDALILPTAPQRAFPHGTPAPANQADFTALANFAGAPAVTLPVPLAGETLPASVQLLGAPWSEARLTAWAEALDLALNP
ncbi:aspartyl-tRNA(Asn)/glutamyl-tRNA(Gln) amidotransferase subunit A [Albimonas donghaensis]|uniref:Aspartyl-tRNA(Asn)/glutamyl-tRNA(Gln) amidotransferase subunit A n=1 Tax=Albimonas donghaensis TaxID=356660 RepID=A0A1H3BPM7_9RHOB|nr:amidase [Albimonas donghaensis]SDX43294.1 aspartyl-tRNA(Asn)/glutamyl-tRNA(Gln) amidotransferase subunit A [Albimonas donghaensis]